MIFNFDVKGLEVVCVAYLSKDPVLCKELDDGVDIHGVNQEVFGLPTRHIAKILIFRIIYGGSIFHTDPDFVDVSSSKQYWDKVISKFYEKYKGIKAWHDKIVQEAGATGKLTSPTGREFSFEYKPGFNGDLKLPVTQIKNHPVQALGADIMSVLRVSAFRRVAAQQIECKFINTVHDSNVLDVKHKEDCFKLKEIFLESLGCFNDDFQKIFGIPFELKISGEFDIGENMFDTEVI